MDETALAVLVFNPQSEDPFEKLSEWDRAIERASRRPFRKLLVAARCDRGSLMVSRDSVEQFQQERNFAAFLETSALTGKGCCQLRETIIGNIPWDRIPWTASPRIFKLLKEAILQLKGEGRTLLRLAELRQQLEMRLPREDFTLDQLRAVIGLLVGPGVVWQLEFGDFVLLQPERINAYAAAVIRKVRARRDEMGFILEDDILAGNLDYQDMSRLPMDEEPIVLRAMHQTFVNHGLCSRETTDAGSLLVFPSFFKRERPEIGDHPAPLVSYRFNGQLDEIYATLIVRLHHISAFEKGRLWKFAADFKSQEGKRIGLEMTKKGRGTAEITIYFEPSVPDDTKVIFIRYIREHLIAKASDVTYLRHYVCPFCHMPVQSHRVVRDRQNRGLNDIVCINCENRIPFWDLIEQKINSEEFSHRVRELEEQALARISRDSLEIALFGHAFETAREAGQVCRTVTNSRWGINGQIELKDYTGQDSGRRIYLQLGPGDSYLSMRKKDGTEMFEIIDPEISLADLEAADIAGSRSNEPWQKQRDPVMLVIRISDGVICWMDVTKYLDVRSQYFSELFEHGLRQHKLRKQHGPKPKPEEKSEVPQAPVAQRIVFRGEPFTALSLQRMRDRLIPLPEEIKS